MITVERKKKLNIQISLDPFLLFVLTSVLLHGLGLLIFFFSNRSRPVARQETESTPIEFITVPPKESPEEPPPDTERRAVNNSVAKGKVDPKLPTATDKIGNEPAIATSRINQTRQPTIQAKPSAPVIPTSPPPPKVKPTPQTVTPPPPLRKVPKREIPTTPLPELIKPTPPVVSKPKPAEKVQPVTPPTPLRKIPKREILTTLLPESIKPTPPVVKKPKPVEKTPLLSESDSTSIPIPKPAPQPEKKPSREIETVTPQTDLPPVATKLPPKPKPIESSSPSTASPSVPKTTPTPSPSPEQKTPVGSGSASLLGGTYRKTLSEDSGSSFFNPQANASQQALNSSGLDAKQNLNMGPYLAEIQRRVKRNWKPSAPPNNRNTVLIFSIQRNGQITGLRVRRSSGSEKIDRESLAAVQKSGPFAALPTNFPKEQLDIEFNFNIYVNQGVISPHLEHWQRF